MLVPSIRAAVADRAIPFDVTANLTLPRARRAEAAMIIPTTAQVGDALHHAPERFVAFVALCAFGGLRLGEAGGLRVSDINFMRREVHIQRQVQMATAARTSARRSSAARNHLRPRGLVNLLSEHVRLHAPGDDPDR